MGGAARNINCRPRALACTLENREHWRKRRLKGWNFVVGEERLEGSSWSGSGEVRWMGWRCWGWRRWRGPTRCWRRCWPLRRRLSHPPPRPPRPFPLQIPPALLIPVQSRWVRIPVLLVYRLASACRMFPIGWLSRWILGFLRESHLVNDSLVIKDRIVRFWHGIAYLWCVCFFENPLIVDLKIDRKVGGQSLFRRDVRFCSYSLRSFQVQSSQSRVKIDSRPSSEENKFAPKFDGLKFIETLVTAHR